MNIRAKLPTRKGMSVLMRMGIHRIWLTIPLLLACPTQPDGPLDAGAQDVSLDPCSVCLETQRCDEGQCVAKCECAANETCDPTGACRLVCASDEDCALGEVCSENACEPGCSTDDRCPEGDICEEDECIPAQCASHADCARGETCQERRCRFVGESPCGEDSDCGQEWNCSSHGLCFEGDCLVHGDCDPSQRCSQGQCLGRIDPALGIQFERRFAAPLTDHLAREPFGAFRGYGLGGALFDFDGDNDLDIFLGYRQRLLER